MLPQLNGLVNRLLHSNGILPGMNRSPLAAALKKLVSPSDSKAQDDSAAQKKDELTLSGPLQQLAKSGLDLERSSIREASQMVDFQLSYEDQQLSRVTANGFYDMRSQSLEASFSYKAAFTLVDPETGEERQEMFQFDLKLEASRIQVAEGESHVEKEDILHFGRKILNKMNKLFSEGKSIDGIMLEDEDLKDLGKADRGKLLDDIMATLQIMRSVDHLRKSKGDHVWITPEREKTAVETESLSFEQEMKLSLNVQRLSISNSGSEESSEASAPEAASVLSEDVTSPAPPIEASVEGETSET